MRIYITRINGWSLRDKSHYMQHMVSEIAHELGCREMGIYRYYIGDESNESLNSRIDGIIAGINLGDIVICQFPTGNGIRFENTLVDHIKAYGGRIAIFVHEIEALSQKEKQFLGGETIGLYNQAEILIVPSYAMCQWLLENGIRESMKFVVQEMWDCMMNDPITEVPMLKKEIYFIDSEGFEGINDWNYSLPLKLYNVLADEDSNVKNMGEREPFQLINELSVGGFGLVWYRDEYFRKYMEQSNSFSVARYLVAGIPIIVPAGIWNQMLIEENHLGLVVNSLEEAVTSIEKMTSEEYGEYVRAVRQFAPALRKGHYTKKCLIEAMLAFYRKDIGKLPIPERIYHIKAGTFSKTALNESFGGNLALAWDYQGEAEGILICDMTGALLGSTCNCYQHYFLLDNQERRERFSVKAYVETLKGKLIVAETELIYFRKRYYGNPKVSMIIPAYNAENHIVRCIDTILAQSQPDVEILIVDDGSTDRTAELIDWYEKKYENVVAIHQKNIGVAAARNIGIKYAKGEYIGFVDADDMIRPSMIERMYQAAKKNDCDIVVTSAYTITDTDYVKHLCYTIKENAPISIDDFFHKYSYGSELGVVVWNKLYRSSLAKKYAMPAIPYEDVAWTTCVLSYANKICYLDDYSYEWDRRGQESSLSKRLLYRCSKQEMFEQRKRAVLFFMEKGNPKKMDLLKEAAKAFLSLWENSFQDKEYGKLRDEIGANY